MRRAGLYVLLSGWIALTTSACAEPAGQVAAREAEAKQAEAEAKANEAPEYKPKRRSPEIVRTDLVASDLPAPPRLDEVEAKTQFEGSFAYPEGTDELAPRAAVELGGGLALVGQAYFQRRRGRVPQTWRWVGLWSPGGAPTSTKLGPGAIRAAVPTADGGAWVTGSREGGDDARGWAAQLDAAAKVTVERDLDSPSLTEMFALVPGHGPDEAAVVAGYVDAQGWLVSVSEVGERRWHKFLSTHGYTQIRGLARLDGERGDLLAIGNRATGFSEPWVAVIPGDGGPDPSPEGAAQSVAEIEGADPHQILHAIVDLGEPGYVALGVARRNHIQAHAQLIAVGFDRTGAISWGRVVPEARVTRVLGGHAHTGAGPAAVARFVVEVPAAVDGGDEANTAMAVIDVEPGPSATAVARTLANTRERDGAVFTGGLVVYGQTSAGVSWTALDLTGL